MPPRGTAGGVIHPSSKRGRYWKGSSQTVGKEFVASKGAVLATYRTGRGGEKTIEEGESLTPRALRNRGRRHLVAGR